MPERKHDRVLLAIRKFAEDYTYESMGAELGVSGSRVRELVQSGLRMMRHPAFMPKLERMVGYELFDKWAWPVWKRRDW